MNRSGFAAGNGRTRAGLVVVIEAAAVREVLLVSLPALGLAIQAVIEFRLGTRRLAASGADRLGLSSLV